MCDDRIGLGGTDNISLIYKGENLLVLWKNELEAINKMGIESGDIEFESMYDLLKEKIEQLEDCLK